MQRATVQNLLKPRPLRPGDCIGIVAPASSVQRSALEQGIARLEQLGYRTKLGDHVYDFAPQYFAGTAEARVADIHAMFTDPEVAAILCARGGYGSNYLLPALDLDLIRRNPKPFIGYSDNTSLLTWITDQTGLVTFHGPMAAKDLASADGIDMESWTQALSATDGWQITSERSGAVTLKPGRADGKLYGGCLSMLVASLGTPYEIRTEDSILFLEDIAAKPYQIDRMLMQMKYAGKLESVRAIIFGEMIDCVQPEGASYSLPDVILRVLGDFPGPIAYGFRSGHVSSGNVTLAIGALAELACDEKVLLRYSEATVAW